MTFPIRDLRIPAENPEDRRYLEQVIDERLRQRLQLDGIQNYRITDLGTNRFTASETSDSYPYGISWMYLSTAAAADGWPADTTATGWVETKVFFRGSGQRISQTFYPKTVAGAGQPFTWVRGRNADDTAWNPWKLMMTLRYQAVTATDSSPTGNSTWEDYHADGRLTITELPDYDNCDFEIAVAAVSSMNIQNTTSAHVFRTRIRISFDGGSTWDNGEQNFGHVGTAGTTLTGHAHHSVYGTNLTGDLHVRPQHFVDANFGDVTFTRSYLEVTVTGEQT